MHPLPAGLYTAAEVRELDRRAIERCDLPGYELMTRAGHATLNALRARWPGARSLVVLCGPGNNGGDGYVVARIARAQGLAVHAVAVADPSGLGGDALHAYDDFRAAGGQLEPWQPQVMHEGRRLKWRELPGRPKKAEVQPRRVGRTHLVKPATGHAWRRFGAAVGKRWEAGMKAQGEQRRAAQRQG